MTTKKTTTTIIETHQVTIIRRQPSPAADTAPAPPPEPEVLIIDVPAQEIGSARKDGQANEAESAD